MLFRHSFSESFERLQVLCPAQSGRSIRLRLSVRLCAEHAWLALLKVTVSLCIGDVAPGAPGESATLRPIVGMLKFICEPQNSNSMDSSEICAQSGHGHGEFRSVCSHVSALLHIIYNLQRHDVNAKHQSRTAHLCKWNVPSDGPMFDPTTPISEIPFSKVAYSRDFDAALGPDGEAVPILPRARAPSNDTTSRRAMWNPFDSLPLAKRMLLTNSSPARKEARRKFYEQLEFDMEAVAGMEADAAVANVVVDDPPPP